MTVTDSQTDRSLMQPKMQSVTEGSLQKSGQGPNRAARLAWKPLSASTELVQVEARGEVRVDDNQSRPDARGGVDGVELVEGVGKRVRVRVEMEGVADRNHAAGATRNEVLGDTLRKRGFGP